jgi:hypothetical protein
VDESNLTQCISQLRKALANGDGRTFVETVPRDAYALRNVNLLYIAIDPVYDKIRDHPRFQKILDGMGLRIAAARN